LGCKSTVAGKKEGTAMSDYIVKIIPADAAYQITEKQAQSVLEFLKANIKSEKIESLIQDSPVFVDCGSNLERILCPHCKVRQDFEWWGKAMRSWNERLTGMEVCCI
jgi:hypothetical protein